MTVEDPAAFVANEASTPAVEAGIAAAAGVDAHKVKATLSVGSSRRLQGSVRRLQGTVDVSAEIQADSAADVAALQTTVSGIEPAAMTESLNTALADTGLTVTVTALEATVSAAPTRYVPPETDNSGGGDDDFATKHGLSLLGVAFIVGSLAV
jgi:hypothetical protein